MTKTFKQIHNLPATIDADLLESIIKEIDEEWLIDNLPDQVLYNGYAINVLIKYLEERTTPNAE